MRLYYMLICRVYVLSCLKFIRSGGLSVFFCQYHMKEYGCVLVHLVSAVKQVSPLIFFGKIDSIITIFIPLCKI